VSTLALRSIRLSFFRYGSASFLSFVFSDRETFHIQLSIQVQLNHPKLGEQREDGKSAWAQERNDFEHQ
jgi:hypothetical protein